MHPSRLVSLCFFVVSVLLVAQFGLTGVNQVTTGAVFEVTGGVILLISSLYGLFRYEENPIVTEYGPMVYLLLFGLVLWAVGMLVSLIAA